MDYTIVEIENSNLINGYLTLINLISPPDHVTYIRCHEKVTIYLTYLNCLCLFIFFDPI